MNPNRHASSHLDYFLNLIKGDRSSLETHRSFYDEYNAVLDMDANYYLETIQAVFQEFKLMNGTWDVLAADGTLERVRPQDITKTRLLTVEGELDDISGHGQTEAAHDLCTGIARRPDDHLEVEGAGHYGIFSGRRWREQVYPLIRDFIAESARLAKYGQGAKPTIVDIVATPSARHIDIGGRGSPGIM
jgi:poly(3-hydroxybutyrate) depolymerase